MRSFADLSRIFHGSFADFRVKTLTLSGCFRKTCNPFTFEHAYTARLFPKCTDNPCLGAREYLQYQGDFIKRFAQIGWVICEVSLRSDCKKENALTARKELDLTMPHSRNPKFLWRIILLERHCYHTSFAKKCNPFASSFAKLSRALSTS